MPFLSRDVRFLALSVDETRRRLPLRFYTLMVISTALFDKPAFKNLIVNGLILAADGKKMSKRLKNYPGRGFSFLVFVLGHR